MSVIEENKQKNPEDLEMIESQEIGYEEEIQNLILELNNLDENNLGLVDGILSKVASLREPLLERLKNQKDMPLSGEEKTSIVEKKKILDPLWGRLNSIKKELAKPNLIEIIPRDQEREEFVKFYEALPSEELKKKFMKDLESMLAQPNEVRITTGLQGIIFEMSRIKTIIDQDLEVLDFEAQELVNANGKGKYTYRGYEKGDHAFDNPPAVDKPINIQLDVPIVRERINGEKVPFVYETKSFPRRMYGKEPETRNQLLKYQKSVELGLVSGAVLELKGRIDPNFLGWAIGTAIDDPGAIPDLEIIYTLPLPSGAEYRFPLKMSRKENGNLKFHNESKQYSEKDKQIIAGIQNALISKDKRIITAILIDDNIEDSEVSKELRPFLGRLEEIEDLGIFNEYENKRLEGIYQKAESAQKSVINETNENSAYSEHVDEAFISQMARKYQEYLRENPEIAKMKRSYTISTDLSTEQYEQAVQKVIDNIVQKVGSIRSVELARISSEEGSRKQRKKMGYVGLPEGVALDVEHIMLDAILEVNKRKDQKGRSYDNFEERFFDVVRLQQFLSDPKLDRRYQELVIFDPLAGDEAKKHQRLKDASEQKIAQCEANVLLDNIKRAEKVIEQMRERVEQLSSLDNSTEEQRRERSTLQKRINNSAKRIDMVQGEIGKLKSAKKEEVERTDKEKKASVAKTFDKEINTLREKLVALYKETMGGERIWNMISRRITERIDRNIIKFIYAVDAGGAARMDEEKFGGAITGRAAHSELVGGRNVYGAGELAFTKVADGRWNLTEINNGSGHYRCSAQTLEYVKNVFDSLGMDTDKAILRDALLRGGMEIRDLSLTF